jgi:hypothetical protein
MLYVLYKSKIDRTPLFSGFLHNLSEKRQHDLQTIVCTKSHTAEVLKFYGLEEIVLKTLDFLPFI